MAMKLDDAEQAMLAGDQGPARQWAIEQQIAVGNFFDARDLVPVHQVHIMADTESLGDSGVEFLEKFAGLSWNERRCLVPTVTDPRGIDLESYKILNQEEAFAGADIIYCKNWSSFSDYGARPEVEKNWTIDKAKMALTNNGKFMHCMPIRRNVIATDEVIDNSIIYQQAANRVCSAQAVLKQMLS